MKQVGNVEEVFAVMKAKKEADISEARLVELIEDLRERPSARKLEKVWRVAFLLRDPDAFVTPWTARERGRMNHIVRDLNGVAAAQLVAEVVQHWDEFVEYLAKRSHKGVGDRPHIGLLAYHRGVAVEWIQSRASACAEPEEGGKGPSWDF